MSFKGVQIKKYKQNRKFYAKELSKYVNLEEIAELFLEERGMIITEHPTDQDITIKTIVAALARVGYFDKQVEVRNLSNIIEAGLRERGINVLE
jgi:hypothetical protein